MLAIVDLNGKQYQVEEGRYVNVDRLPHNENEELQLNTVLMVVDGEQSLVGAPYVEGATVKARVLRHARGPKLLVYKMRCKKGYRLKNGHRQDFTQLQIEVVDFPGKKAGAPAEKKAEKPATKKAAKADPADAAEKPAKKTTAKASATKAAAPKKETTKKPKAEAKPAEVAEAAPEASTEE